jgi:hypothetical protein
MHSTSTANKATFNNASIILHQSVLPFADMIYLRPEKFPAAIPGRQAPYASAASVSLDWLLRRRQINRTYLNMILSGKKPVGDAVAKALGLHKVYIAE